MTTQTISSQRAADLLAGALLMPSNFGTGEMEPTRNKMWQAKGMVRDYAGFLADVAVWENREGMVHLSAHVRPDRYTFTTILLPSMLTEEAINTFAAYIHKGMVAVAEEVLEMRRRIDEEIYSKADADR